MATNGIAHLIISKARWEINFLVRPINFIRTYRYIYTYVYFYTRHLE